MGKAKKIGLGIGISVLIFFVMIIGIAATSNTQELQEGNERVSLESMSFEALEKISHDWTYKDMLRNIGLYEEKIIYVEGIVVNTQRDADTLTLCVEDSVLFCEDFMFIDVNDKTVWLEDDKLSGFVKVKWLSETGRHSPMTGEFVGSGDYIPKVKEIKLTCSNC